MQTPETCTTRKVPSAWTVAQTGHGHSLLMIASLSYVDAANVTASRSDPKEWQMLQGK
jgi:hypothetical protein